jgi:hypothetical protein
MKRSRSISVLKFAAICILTLGLPCAATNGAVQHGFQLKEYELFHDVLQPLQHEALPEEDFQRIRTMANELVTRGKAIVKLDLPQAPPNAKRREFAKSLREFDRALARFNIDARAKNNTRLKKSYIAVHDSFEKLAELVPSVYPMGDPPIASIRCPSNKVDPGEITLAAMNDALDFRWTAGAAKILAGQGTRVVTIDTAGLAGQTITIVVEVNYGNGFVALAACVIQISADK